MTGAPIALAHVPGYLPDLVQGAALIALVPTEPDAAWSGEAAWTVARETAVLGRRTLLVDCFVDEPRLHTAADTSNDDGIVDAFEYGASLNRIARRQGESGLYFVPAGTFAADPAELMGNPRWSRLAAGFKHEGALLIVYLPSASLPLIANVADAVIVLAPDDFDFDRDASGGLVEGAQFGKPTIIVSPGTHGAAPPPDIGPEFEGTEVGFANTFELVPEAGVETAAASAFDAPADGGWEPPPPPAPRASSATTASPRGYAPTAYDAAAEAAANPPPPPVAAEAAPEPAPPPAGGEGPPERPALRRTRPPFADLDAMRGSHQTRRAVVYTGVAVVGIWLAMLALRPEWILPVAPPAEAPALPAAGAAHQPDSLPWVVQVSAWNDAARAYEALDTLAGRHIPALVTPVRLAKGVSWRVQAGPLASQQAAELLLDTLRAHGLADPDGSVAIDLPLSFTVGTGSAGPSGAGVRADRDSLRARGVPTFVLNEAGGRPRLFAGAFETAADAAFLDSLLFTLGRARRIGPRVGYLP